MSSDNPFLDNAGAEVIRFISAARNLTRLGELTDEVVAIAKSGAWRRYRTAVGVDEWRECELDYFLIACDLRHEDVSRIVAYTREGTALAPLMDHAANNTRRRTLEEAAAAWHAPVPETLLERAQRLGWTRGDTSTTLRVAPVPERARARQAHGVTMDEHARRTRESQLPAERRRELDDVARTIADQAADDAEIRYVVDALRNRLRRRGRPRSSEAEQDRWRRDVERLGDDTEALAREWGVTRKTARARVRRLRQP